MLTAPEVCKELRISRDTLLKLIHQGEFPGAMKVPPGPTGHWRFPDGAVTDYMQRNGVALKPEAAS